MEACLNDFNKDLIKLNKIATGNFMDYNSWERPKRELWVPGHHVEVKKLNLCFDQNDLNIASTSTQGWLNSLKESRTCSAKQDKTDVFINDLSDILKSKKDERGRKMLEKDKHPKDRLSRKFFSEEKYHYSQNLEIEEELRLFKREIEARFK